MNDVAKEALNLIEPEASKLANIGCTATECASVSAAISLKRIADALTYQSQGGQNVYDFLRSICSAAEAVENRR